MLKERRKLQKKFNQRNYKKWQKGFDLLEMLLEITEETGSNFNDVFRPTAVQENNFVFEVLTLLHSRALLVAREILCLLKSGFSDGALARWRSLHENAVTACFIEKYGAKVAKKYLISFKVQSYKAMQKNNIYAERNGLESFQDSEIESAKIEYDNILLDYGNEMKNDYGWAANILKKKKPQFSDLEKDINLDHWRPFYKWASHYSHSNHKPPSTLLGMCEAKKDFLLVGPSNSGLTDPAQLTAISLNHTTSALLLTEPNLDRLVIVRLLTNLAEEIGEAFLNADTV